MKWVFVTTLLLIGVSAVVWIFGERTLKTLFLIARVSPYERTIEDAPQILILGDSTGYGTGASAANKSVAGQIGADYPSYTIENMSKNGRTIGELVPVAEALTGQYKLILLQIGGNDILQKRNVDEVESELRRIVETLRDNTEHLVMISTGNVGASTAFSSEKAVDYEQITRAFKAMFARVAKDTALTFVDLFEEPENDPFVVEPVVYLSVDGLHPSDAGYGEWYEKLRPIVEQSLQEND